MNLNNVGGALSGGTALTLIPAHSGNANKVSFVGPTHTRAAPRRIDFSVTPMMTPKKGQASVARTNMQVYFGQTKVDETCCGADAFGSIIFDVGSRWHLGSVTEATVDEAVQWLRSAVFTPEFAAALKKGILPA